MSDKIVSLSDKRITSQRHLAGRVKCLHCGHTWTGVAPIKEMDGLQCPECELYRGSFMGNIDAEQGDIQYVCSCGGMSYFIKLSKTGFAHVICHGCGGIKGTFVEATEQL